MRRISNQASKRLDLSRSVIRIGSAIGANHLFNHVALKAVRTALCNDARRLVRKMLSRIDHFGFDGDYLPNVLAVTGLADLPLFLSHTAPPVFLYYGFLENARQ